MIFYHELDFLRLFLFAKKMKMFSKGGFIVFSGLPLALYFMHGHSFVELTEHDISAADIIVHSMYMHICTAAFLVHNLYRK